MKFKVDNRGSDGTGCFRIKLRIDTAEFTVMRIAELRKRRDLIGEGKMFVKNKTKFADPSLPLQMSRYMVKIIVCAHKI